MCFIAKLKPGTEDEYKRRHDEIWPEMVVALRESGFANFSLFRRGLTVVAYAECDPSVLEAISALEATDVNQRWSDYIADVFSEARDDAGSLLFADELWYLA